jgi:hypothetical protein
MNDVASKKEIFALFGAASYRATAFEQELIIMHLAVARLKDPSVSASAMCQLNRELSDKPTTLGTLLGRAKQTLRVQEDVEAAFDAALEARNDLVHRFWYWTSGVSETEDAYASLLAWLREAILKFRRAEHEARQLVDAIAQRVSVEQVKQEVLDHLRSDRLPERSH